jgi:hypothetical protein
VVGFGIHGLASKPGNNERGRSVTGDSLKLEQLRRRGFFLAFRLQWARRAIGGGSLLALSVHLPLLGLRGVVTP